MRNVKAGVEAGDLSPRGFPPPSPSEDFCRHFFKCFFCHIGDRYTEDHFCETGRDLIVRLDYPRCCGRGIPRNLWFEMVDGRGW